MANEEKSRDAFQPDKRYAAVGMQQGRVMLDDDFNENARIRLEEERRVNLDVIGPAGSPDGGFALSNGAITNGGVDFDIAAGTFYVGGLRLWNPSTMRFQLQDDWLQQSSSDRPAPVEGRVDLAYVEAWQQPVTATEDTELFEVALGGPDTSTRLRTMWRVRLATGISGTDCAGAWTSLVSQWTAAGLGTIDGTGERQVDAMLKVGYFKGQVGDLCTPAIAGGYLGAENQTIRVQLVDKTTFTWGFDNAAPVYQADIAGNDKVTLASDPRDQAHWPVAGQVVEILPPSARLPNDEKLAEQTGFLTRVKTSFDPVTHALVIDPPIPSGFGAAWQQRSDHAQLHGAGYFVRVWDRGDDLTSPAAIPIGTNVKLGTTGIDVTITGTALVAGDHWIIAARPKTPQVFVPWDLEDGRPVQGTRRFFAPLALIEWHADGSFDVLHDCRPSFPPLTRLRGCCTYTVGDGTTTFGQFTSIQAAVQALPAAGGKICVLAGTYTENVTIADHSNVTIEGCGRRTVIAPRGAGPAIAITNSAFVTVRKLAIAQPRDVGISADDRGDSPGAKIHDLELVDLELVASDDSAISVRNAARVTIARNTVSVDELAAELTAGKALGRAAAVFASGDRLRIEDNEIVTASSSRYSRSPYGGIQIGGGSTDVEVRRNRVAGGAGHAITLGSVVYVPQPQLEELGTVGWIKASASFTRAPAGHWLEITDQGCVGIVWEPDPPKGGDGNPLVPMSEGDLDDVRIVENELTAMAFGGIAVARFFSEDYLQYITTDRLVISNNRIHDNLQCANVEIIAAMRALAAFGAIALADGADIWIRDNVIVDNGPSQTDPICGVFALRAEAISIENNRIVDNAPPSRDTSAAKAGMRGGVVLPRVTTPTTYVAGTLDVFAPRRGYPAARIEDNIVSVPLGRAVFVVGDGEIVVHGNQLSSHGIAVPLLGIGGYYAKVAAGGLVASDYLDAITRRSASANAAPKPASDVYLMYQVGGTSGTGTWSTTKMWDTVATGAALGTAVLDGFDLLGAATVLVVDLGRAPDLAQAAGQRGELAFGTGNLVEKLRPVLAAKSRLSGKLAFADNQVTLDVVGGNERPALCSVLLASLDDIELHGNQLEALASADPVDIDAFVVAATARASTNRFTEPVHGGGGKSVSRLSLGLFGLAAQATSNTATNCISVVASAPAWKIDANNLELGALGNSEACAAVQRLGAALSTLLWYYLQTM